jgi:integrase
MAARDRRTPIQAKHFMSAMRGLFRWAFRAKLIKSDPTAGVNDLSLPKTDGHLAWSDDDVTAYEARWPIGTRQRIWFDVLAYTGLRRGDAVRLGRQHVRNGLMTIKTEKTGAVVTLPILATLAETLSAGPMRRPDVHSRQAWPSAYQRVVWQSVSRSVSRCPSDEPLSAWFAQSCRDTNRRARRDGS